MKPDTIEPMEKVRTRFAPSPTGFLHIGGLRTALYSYALAKSKKGEFLLRIEDTDKKREVEGASQALQDTLRKFGLVWDELHVQSERQKEGIYKEAAEKLVNEGHAFYCQCEARNAKDKGFSRELRDPCRDKDLASGAVKLKVPSGQTLSYFDFVHKKEISWSSDDVYDATLLKSDGFPTYHLAVAVDDLDMNISHILRGHDWLPSTPIHLMVFSYLGERIPKIGHLTDILSAESGKKLSKRRDSVFVEQFLEEGFLPEALLNFVMLLGWAPKDNREIFSLQEFVDAFDINGFGDANPKFMYDKLFWMNQQCIQNMPEEKLAEIIFEFFDKKYPKDTVDILIPLVNTRIKTLKEFESMAGFFFSEPEVDKALLGEEHMNHLQNAIDTIEKMENWELDALNEKLMTMVKEKNFHTGKFFMDLRIAITGNKSTPPINDSIIILGREETVKRLQKALE